METNVIAVVCVDEYGDIEIDTFTTDDEGVKAAEACFIDHMMAMAEHDDDADLDDPEAIAAILDDGFYRPNGSASLPLVVLQWT